MQFEIWLGLLAVLLEVTWPFGREFKCVGSLLGLLEIIIQTCVKSYVYDCAELSNFQISEFLNFQILKCCFVVENFQTFTFSYFHTVKLLCFQTFRVPKFPNF